MCMETIELQNFMLYISLLFQFATKQLTLDIKPKYVVPDKMDLQLFNKYHKKFNLVELEGMPRHHFPLNGNIKSVRRSPF